MWLRLVIAGSKNYKLTAEALYKEKDIVLKCQ